MWLSSTNRKLRASNNNSNNPNYNNNNAGSASLLSNDTLVDTTTMKKDDWQSTMPLDWTKMNHGKRKAMDNNADDNINNSCSDSSNCPCRRRHHHPRHRPRHHHYVHHSKRTTTTDIDKSRRDVIVPTTINNNNDTQWKPSSSSSIFHGKAIFCLHELDPPWLQGYFIPHGSNKKPWRMLAVQEEIDDCLACSDGGYRRVTLTLYPPNQQHHHHHGVVSTQNKNVPKSILPTISNIDWIGGDMMTLYHPDHIIEMIAEQLLTGKAALPLLYKYFTGLVMRLQPPCNINNNKNNDNNNNNNNNNNNSVESVLRWLPNVAIITGSMILVQPKE
jgi:hypothetical protein